MFVVERFIEGLVNSHGQHPIFIDGGIWYPQVYNLLKLDHHIHSFFSKEEKSLIERTMQYINDRTENFDNYFPCRKKKCKLNHAWNWLRFFLD